MHAMGQAPTMGPSSSTTSTASSSSLLPMGPSSSSSTAMPNLEAGGFPTAGMAGGLPTANMAALMAELYSLREASAVASRASHATPPPGALPAPTPAGGSWGGSSIDDNPMIANPIGWVKHRLGF